MNKIVLSPIKKRNIQFKGYLHKKMLTSKNAAFETQFKFFLFH